MSIVSIMPLRPVHKAYSYRAVDALHAGQVVLIPFGRKKDVDPTLGVVWNTAPDHTIDPDKLKDCVPLLEWPLLHESLMRFLEWSANYTLSPLGSFLRMALPIADVTRPTPHQTRYRLVTDSPIQKMTPARQKVIDLLRLGGLLTRTEIKGATHVSDSVLNSLHEGGIL
jgi:primosomal protein N' (replication factor Y)